MTSLSALIDRLLRGEISFDSAKLEARRLGNDNGVEAEIWEIVRKVDRLQLQQSQPEYEFAASQLCQEAAHQSTDLGLQTALAFIQGRVFLQRDDAEKARLYFARAESLCRQLGDRRQLAAILGSRASLLLSQGKLDEALALYDESIGIAKELDDHLSLASNEFGIGLIKLQQGLPQEALVHLRKALDTHRFLGNDYEEFKVLMTLADLASSLNREEEQHNYLLQAAGVASAACLPPSIRRNALAKLSMLQIKKGQLADAAKTLEQALEACRQDRHRALEGFLAGNLGAVYSQLNRAEESRPLLELALQIAVEQNDAEGVRIAQHNLQRLKEIKSPRAAKPQKGVWGKLIGKFERDDRSKADRIINTLNNAAARIAQSPGSADVILDGIGKGVPSNLRADTSSYVVSKILERINEIHATDPRLGYALSVVVSSWAPDNVEPELLTRVFQKVGAYSWSANQIEQAVVAFSRAAAVAHAAHINDQFLVSATNLGSVLRQAGRPMDAVQAYNAAVDAIEPDTRPAIQGMVLLNASTAYSDLGLHQQSKEISERAIALLRDEPDQVQSLALCYTNLGGALYGLGDLEGSEQNTVKALEIMRREGIRSQEGVALGHLGLLRQRQGRFMEAVPLLERALKIAEDTNDWWNTQHWRTDLANTYLWTQRPEPAIEHFKKALDVCRRVGDRRSEGKCLMGLGVAYLSVDLDKAIAYLKDAWDIEKDTANIQLAREVAVYLSQAYAGEALGYKELLNTSLDGWESPSTVGAKASSRIKDRKALEHAGAWLRQAIDLHRSLGHQDLSLSIAMQSAQLQSLNGEPEAAAETLREILDASGKEAEAELVQAHVLLGNIYLSELNKPELALTHVTKALESYERMARGLGGGQERIHYRNNFTPLYLRAVDCALLLGRRDTAFELCERSKVAEMRRLWALSPEKQRTHDSPSLAELTTLVGEKGTVAVVEFFLSFDRTYVWVVAPGLPEDQQLLVLDSMNVIEAGRDLWVKLQQSYQDLNSPRAAFDANRPNQWVTEVDRVRAELGNRLLARVFDLIKDLPVRQVVFVPHQFLHCFPLHAAPVSETETWLDRYDVSYVPSSTVLVNQWSGKAEADYKFAAFADPGGDLPLARVEAQLAARHFPGAEQVYLGEEASEQVAIRALSECTWLHFACHASHTLLDNFSSGIHLAGQGVAGGAGLLNLYRINRDVRLAPSTSVILSACETGTVTPVLADEFISLAGGFIAAGARAVVASYWKVKDACAALVLDKFYHEVRDNGRSFAGALREAEIWVRSLNEEQIYDSLDRLLNSGVEVGTTDAELALAPYSQCREDFYPFRNATDWAGFYVCGMG